MRIHHTIDMLQESEHLPVILQKTDYWLIHAGQLLIWLISPWIMDRPTVENISSAISGKVIRQTFLERKAAHLDMEPAIFA
jgi:hypothetical protein